MEVLYLLIPIALILVALMAVAVVWAISSGQYDDLERAGEDVLLDDDEVGMGLQDPGFRNPDREPKPDP